MSRSETRGIKRSRGRDVIGLAGWLAACLGIAQAGALVTGPAIPGWYAQLAKPVWTPPSLAFPIVWTALYITMAVAVWLVWRETGLASAPIALFIIQLGLNAAWSWIFFGLRSPGAAFTEILLLWLAILATTLAFLRRRRLAGWLLVPYLAWASFAAVLNFTIWRMNA